MSKYRLTVCKTHDCGSIDEAIENLIDTLRYIESPAVKKTKGHIMFVPTEVNKIERFIVKKLKSYGVTEAEAYGYNQISIGSADINEFVSSCHLAGTYIENGVEGTNHYRCGLCGEPCDRKENMLI